MEAAIVHLQGITPDLATADGDYDTQYTYGLQTAEQVQDFFARVQHLQAPPGDDRCPPSVVLEQPSQTLHFSMGDGGIWCAQAEAPLALDQVLHIVQYPGSVATIRQQMRVHAGVHPVRMAHVPPTDPELSDTEIDTGPQSPQVSFRLLKSGDAKHDVWVAYGLGIVLAGLGILTFTSGGIVGGAGIAGVGILCLFLGRVLSGRTRTLVRFGLDWKTNTLWCEDPETLGRPRIIPNANLIARLHMEQDHRDESDHVEGNRLRVKYAHLHADFVDGGRDFFVKDIYGRDEADEVLAAITHLLNQQG